MLRQIYTSTLIHTMEYYSASEKEEILPFVITQMNLEGNKLSEINQTRKNNSMISLTQLFIT